MHGGPFKNKEKHPTLTLLGFLYFFLKLLGLLAEGCFNLRMPCVNIRSCNDSEGYVSLVTFAKGLRK